MGRAILYHQPRQGTNKIKSDRNCRSEISCRLSLAQPVKIFFPDSDTINEGLFWFFKYSMPFTIMWKEFIHFFYFIICWKPVGQRAPFHVWKLWHYFVDVFHCTVSCQNKQ